MIHTTYRRLDEPPKLAGFSFAQWAGLLVLAGAVYALEALLALATEPAITVFVFLVGLPACLTFFSEHGRPPLSRLGRDAARWLCSPRTRSAGPGTPRPVALVVQVPKPVRERRRLRRRSHPALVDGVDAAQDRLL